MPEYGDLGGAVGILVLIALIMAWAHLPDWWRERREQRTKRPYNRERDL